MRSVAALLAAVLACGLGGCNEDGAEPGASREATLVLDFQPNAVHAGIYAALERGYYEDAGVDLELREPSASTDAPKLLEAGRAEFAILDINDLGIARDRGFDLVAIAAIVQRPLAAVIAADAEAVRTPRDLEGGEVGVTGLPSDDAVLETVLERAGADPSSVEPVTIGFDSVAALASGRLDAATAFWNAEGVALRRLGVPTREFRIERPRYPELVLVTRETTLAEDPDLARDTVAALARGYELLARTPDVALEALLDQVPELEPAEQEAQLDALLRGHAFRPTGGPVASLRLDSIGTLEWLHFALRHDIVGAGLREPEEARALFDGRFAAEVAPD